jgi:hypothetical protein
MKSIEEQKRKGYIPIERVRITLSLLKQSAIAVRNKKVEECVEWLEEELGVK